VRYFSLGRCVSRWAWYSLWTIGEKGKTEKRLEING
jgi:hypothetical protein